MDWDKFLAACIRAFWTAVFPLIGAGVAYAVDHLAEIGVNNAALALVVGAFLYGLKKYLWPDTVL